MYVHQKLLQSKFYKSFLTGKFSLSIPENYIQLLAISDSVIDFYLIIPEFSISLVSSTNLSLLIISSCKFTNLEKNLLLISIESFNNEIEILLLEFNELVESFQTISKFTMTAINKKKAPFEFQGLKVYSKNNKIIASGFINYIGVLTYDEKNRYISYDKEIYLSGFFGEITFEENGKYIYVLCNNEESSNKFIYKTLNRIDFYKYEIIESKIAVAENINLLIQKNIWINFDTFIYNLGQLSKLEKPNFDKKERKDKTIQNSIISSESSLTNYHIFDEFLLIGFDDGKIMLYNRFKIQLSGTHSFFIPNCSDVLFYEMLFLKHVLFCLVCSTNSIKLYNLNYERAEGGELIIIENLQNAMIEKNLLNSVIDSTVIKQQETSKIICLMAESRLNSYQEVCLKQIEYGLKPMPMVRFELKLKDTCFLEYKNFFLFEMSEDLILFFVLNQEMKLFQWIRLKNILQEINCNEFMKEANLDCFLDVFQINQDLICFIKKNSIFFLKTSDDYSKNEIILKEKINTEIHLLCKKIHFDELILTILLNDNKLLLFFFKVEKNKVFLKEKIEKLLQKNQFENIFIYYSDPNYSIILTYFNKAAEIIEFDYNYKRFCDITSSFFPDLSIYSIETLSFNSNEIIFISTYSCELFIITNKTEKSKKKLVFDSGEPFKLKYRTATSLYLYSYFETYIIEYCKNDETENIRCVKVLFELEKQPYHLNYSFSNNLEICLKGKEVSFYNLKADYKNKLITEVQDFPLKFQMETIGKKFLMPKESPTKKTTLKKDSIENLKRLNYSELNKILLLMSNNLFLLIVDPFIAKLLGTFDLRHYFFKNLQGDHSLSLFKLVKFPNNTELLCIGSTLETEEESMDIEEDEEILITNQLNFCQLIPSPNISLHEFTYDIEYASQQLHKQVQSSDPIMDIAFLFELDVFIIAVGGMLEIYAFETETKENLNIKFNLVLQYNICKKIICLDTCDKNIVLAGDYAKSLYIFKLEKSLNANEKIVYQINLIRSEKEQRLLSAGRIIDSETVIGIDKYGDCFISKINDENYADCNNNLVNYSLISLRDPSRNIHLLDQTFNYTREIQIKGKIKEENEESKFILITTLMGGLHQMKLVNLIYLYDNEEINSFVENFIKFLQKKKISKICCDENNILQFSSLFKPIHKFINYEMITEFLEENNVIQSKMFATFYQETSMKTEFTDKEIILGLKKIKQLM